MTDQGQTEEVVMEGEVERITFENPDTGFRVLKIAVDGREERLTVVGTLPPLAAGARVRVRGLMAVDRKHGEQLRASHVVELAPNTLTGVEKYLGSGMIRGLGERYARRIVEHFGLDTLRVLDSEPDRLREVEGLGKKRAETIAQAWTEQRSLREVMVFLQAHGASAPLAIRIFKRYGRDAMRVVAEQPYRLALEVWGVGFKTADRLAKGLGIARDSPQRFQAGLFQALHDSVEAGHSFVFEDDLFARAASLLGEGEDGAHGFDAAAERRALDALTLAGLVVPDVLDRGAGEARIVYRADLFAAERRLAGRLLSLASAEVRPVHGVESALAEFERRRGIELAPEQRNAVISAARHAVLVITGGPGVGKTTLVRALLFVLERAGVVVRLAAPTGRAAKRMTESTGALASTLHRLLEFDPKTNAFKRDSAHPVEASALIVDEASMVDLFMADAVAQAVALGSRLILVGDVDQLPSVGPGAVLRDILASDRIPSVRLVHVFRQAQQSLIVVNAHRINEGLPPAPATMSNDVDFYVIERPEPERAAETVLELVTTRIPRRFGLDPVRDVQVLTPMHRGPLGAQALNIALQAAQNPNGASLVRGSRTFRVGDKVMQLRNDYDRNVWNGDVGIVSAVDPQEGTLVVRFEDAAPAAGSKAAAPPASVAESKGEGASRTPRPGAAASVDRDVAYDGSSLDELTLAYASTVHKSQGSEYPAVVVVLSTHHFVMLSRNLLYTAVTRGKKLVVLVTDRRALSLALGEGRRTPRESGLQRRLANPALTDRGKVTTLQGSC